MDEIDTMKDGHQRWPAEQAQPNSGRTNYIIKFIINGE